MLTYIHVKNRGCIVMSIKVVVGSQHWANIQHMGQCFTGFHTDAEFGVLVHSKYLCLAIRSDTTVFSLERLLLKFHFLFLNLILFHSLWSQLAWNRPCNDLPFHSRIQLLYNFVFKDSLCNSHT